VIANGKTQEGKPEMQAVYASATSVCENLRSGTKFGFGKDRIHACKERTS